MSTVDPTAQREFATEVVRRLVDAGHRALWAGGCVRDLLLGKVPKDFDIATDAHPARVRAVLRPRKTLAVGESFGVIIVLGPPLAGQVEVATFRTDGTYSDGRRPDQVIFSTPEEDAQRRDFTINGMFFDPLTETVLDYVGGERDLHAGIIRAIGEPARRFQEDKLRMLRAVRFAAHLDFEIEPETVAAIQSMAQYIGTVSAERITQELRRMLTDRHRRRAMRLTQHVGLLELIFPELSELLRNSGGSEWNLTLDMLDKLDTPQFELALAILLQGLPAEPISAGQGSPVIEVCRRLRLSNKETERIQWLVGHRELLDRARELPVSTLKRLLTHPASGELLEFKRVADVARREDTRQLDYVQDFLERTPRDELDPPPLISGHDVIQLGVAAGPLVADLLEQVRIEQLEGRIRTREEALTLVASSARATPRKE